MTTASGLGVTAPATGVDPLGAFCAHAAVARAGAAAGPLRGRRFAAKDVFQVAGVRACFGNPTWLASHVPAAASARVIDQLLGAGANLVGLTLTDELAFSLTGENAHYGTPLNSAAPDRVPGGSSSGSAAAVAGGAADFALGTDTGGSVRVPASHCGLYGFRPSHGAISLDGVLPFAPRFDTVGWFARDAETLAAVGDVLLPADAPGLPPPRRLRLLEDALALLDRDEHAALRAAAGAAAAALEWPVEATTAADADAGPLASWLALYAALQNADVARVHRDWVARHQPRFGPVIAQRMAGALAMDAAAEAEALARLPAVHRRVAALLEGGALLVVPAAGGVAPPRGAPTSRMDHETVRSLTVGAVASLGGLPQVCLPLCLVDGGPLGLSLIGAPGSDRALLATAVQLTARLAVTS